MNNSDKLRTIAKLIAIPLANTDNIKWPIRSGQIISFVNDIYANEFISDLTTMVNTLPREKWQYAFFNSLSIWKISHHIINGLCKSGISKEKVASDILLMCEVLDEITHGNWLSADNHKVLSTEEIESIYNLYINQNCKYNQSTSPLAILSAFLWAYSDTLFFQGREICCERHGLYSTESNYKLFITDIKNIDEAACNLWPDTYKKMHNSFIRIILVYDNTFDITIDPYNNTDLINGSFIESCCGGLLIIDGAVMSYSEISLFFNDIAKRIEQQAKTVNSLTRDALINQYINIFWYRKKRLSTIVNNDWRPSRKIYELIDIKSIESTLLTNSKVLSFESQVKKYDFSKYIT